MNTILRVATAVVLIPLVLAAVWWGGTEAIAVATALVGVLALREFMAIGDRAGLRGDHIWTGLCAIAVIFGQWTSSGAQYWTLGRNLRLTRSFSTPAISLEAILFVFVLGAAVIAFISDQPVSEALGGIAISAAGLLFVILPFSAVIRIDAVETVGKRLLLFTLVFIWVGDTAAYFAGRWFGQIPMAPHLSPKKTWEGAAANLVGSLIVGAIAAHWLGFETHQALMLAGLGNIAGQAGDLLESSYKRSAGVKDSGKLLPGHGGMLDRIDALILAAPMVWYYFHWAIRARS